MTRPTKNELRTQLRQVMRQMGGKYRLEQSEFLCARVLEASVWQAARSVLLFAPRIDEPDVWPLVRQALDTGKEVSLPSFDPVMGAYGARRLVDPEKGLCPGKFGIHEPANDCLEVELAGLDLVLVPGLAFTVNGGRLGRGAGFYDRLLMATGAVRMGVGLDEQIVPWLPMEPHDVKLDWILTPSCTHDGLARFD